MNDTNFESLKPLYGTKGNPPYYDPNDLHVHVWKKGKLGLEDNPKIRTYAKGKLTVKDCVYCKICHLVKDAFQSKVSCNVDIVDDIIMSPMITTVSDYRIIENSDQRQPFQITSAPPRQTVVIKEVDTKIFHPQEGIFDDYVEVTTD